MKGRHDMKGTHTDRTESAPAEDLPSLVDVLETERLSRQQLLRISGASAVALMASPLLAASAAASPGKAARLSGASLGRKTGGAIVGALASDFQTFDPMNATTVTSIGINTHVFEPLIEISLASRQYSPALATAMPKRIDATHYRVTIRDGAKFHDGSPVRPEDVVYSFRRVQDPKNASFFAQFVDFIKSVKKVGPRTVEFTLKYPTNLLVTRLPVVKIVPKAIASRDAKVFALKPVGSGPYRFVSAKNNANVRLQRFAGYNGPRPGHIDNITFMVTPDGPSRTAALRSGTVKVVESPPDRDLRVIKDTKGLTAKSLHGFMMQFLMFNCKKVFRDPRLRQALNWAIDRESIAKNVFLGNAQSAVSYLTEDHPNFVRPSTVYKYSPDKARKLLSAAGYDKTNPLRFDMLVFDEVPWIRDSFTIIQQNWADLGVEPRPRGGGESLYSRYVVDKGDYDAFLALADQSIFGYDGGLLLGWHYGQTWTQRLYFWDSPEQKKMLNLLAQSTRETNAKRQQAIYAQLQNLAADQVPLYPVHHRDTLSGWSTKALAKFQPIRTAGLDLRSAELAR